MKLNRNKKAFTIIELLVVIAILGILVLIAGPKLLGYVQKAELVRIQHNVKVMEQEMKIALIDEEVEIAHWGNNKKNLGALVMQDKLFEKEGVAERIDGSHLLENNKGSMLSELVPNSELGVGGNLILINGEDDNVSLPTVDETYKIVPSEYKDVIGTRLSGTFYTNAIGKVYYEHDKPILGQKSGDKTLDCPLPLPDYDFEPETGTIVKWYGTVNHLVIPEAFLAELNGEEQCVPVRIIGTEAFMQGGFKSIVIPQSVIRIEFNAFKDNLLTTINIPHSVNYIGGGAFSGNSFGSGGGSVTIRNNSSNITIISGAFGGSTPTYRPVTPQDLNVVFYPSSGRIVSMGAGGGSSITIPESFQVGGVEYPVKQIDKGAYQGLGLISVILPSGLERIEDYAFAGNQLEGITIPDKVNHIGNYAFAFNEVEHTITGHRKATIGFINIKNEEQFSKVNQYGNIYEDSVKVDKLKGEVKLLDHTFVTSIGNHVIDEKYVESMKPVDKSGLQSKLSEVSGLKESDYSAGWEELQDEISEASKVVNKTNATDAEIATAIANLNSAISGLTKKPTNPIPPIVNGKLPGNIESLTASSTITWGGIYYDPWYALDGKYDIMQNGWAPNQTSNAWLAVKFDKVENINMVKMANGPNVYAMGEHRAKDFRIEYYDESSNKWNVAYQGQMQHKTGWQEFEFDSKGSHKQWRLWIINHGYGDPGAAGLGIGEIQFLHK